MRGKMDMQINHLFNASEIFTPGESKHEMKENLREEFIQQGKGSPTWADFGDRLTICSYKTAETYKDVWHQVGDFAKEQGVKNFEKIDGNIISKFLESRVDQDVSLSTFRVDAAACGKLEMALNMYSAKFETGNSYQFDIKDVRSMANEKLEMFNGTRAYDNPIAVIGALEGKSALIASLQLEGGFRISEVLTLKDKNLQEGGKIHIENTKGGLPRNINLSSETYGRLENYLKDNSGRFCEAGQIDKAADCFRTDLKEAAINTGQAYTGSHGLRWNYCQESYSNHLKNGDTTEKALSSCSSEMGHRRSDITLHYLK